MKKYCCGVLSNCIECTYISMHVIWPSHPLEIYESRSLPVVHSCQRLNTGISASLEMFLFLYLREFFSLKGSYIYYWQHPDQSM